MEMEVGAVYECSGTVQDEGFTTITIEITDEDGGYTWSESAS
jgi:hypothetical protein